MIEKKYKEKKLKSYFYNYKNILFIHLNYMSIDEYNTFLKLLSDFDLKIYRLSNKVKYNISLKDISKGFTFMVYNNDLEKFMAFYKKVLKQNKILVLSIYLEGFLLEKENFDKIFKLIELGNLANDKTFYRYIVSVKMQGIVSNIRNIFYNLKENANVKSINKKIS